MILAILIAALAVLMPGVLGPKSAGDLSGRFLRYSSLLHWGAYPEIGMLALLGAAAALAILLTAPVWRLRIAAGMLAVVFGAVPFVVNSRGAVVALIATAGWLVAVVVLRGRRRLAWLLVGVVCVVGLAGAVVYRARIARIAQSSGDMQATAAVSSRTEDWRVAVRMIAAHPLFGVGPGRFPARVRDLFVSFVNAAAESRPQHAAARRRRIRAAGVDSVCAGVGTAVVADAAAHPASAQAAERRDAFVLHALIAAFFIRAMTDQFLSSVHSSFRTTLLMAIVLGLGEASARVRR